MKLIIAGSREYDRFAHAEKVIARVIAQHGPVSEIVSGGARGADQLGERYARKHHIPLRQFLPEWDRLGKRAGYVRNEQMANYGDALLVFWDGVSRGTQSMIQLAQQRKLLVVVDLVTIGAAHQTADKQSTSTLGEA